MYYGVIFTYISLFRTMPVYTHKHTSTRILKPFEDRELTGLKVDIAYLGVSVYHLVYQRQMLFLTSWQQITAEFFVNLFIRDRC